MRFLLALVTLLFVTPWTPLVRAQDDVGEILEKALAASREQPSEEAVDLLSQVIQQKPDLPLAWYHRGREQFRLGRIAQSVKDFDKFVELQPQADSRQWERGIAYFYAGEYAKGAKQFELYQTFHDQDVENSTWRYLCLVPLEGVEKAREKMLPIKEDRRVPMMQIYDLYRGKATPEDVLKATKELTGDSKQAAEFYAHLYLGLWYDAAGKKEQAKEHIFAAEQRPIRHYMFDVARVHAEKLRAEAKAQESQQGKDRPGSP
jgi:lipoprotein NlpI